MREISDEAVPPSYTEHIGQELSHYVETSSPSLQSADSSPSVSAMSTVTDLDDMLDTSDDATTEQSEAQSPEEMLALFQEAKTVTRVRLPLDMRVLRYADDGLSWGSMKARLPKNDESTEAVEAAILAGHLAAERTARGSVLLTTTESGRAKLAEFLDSGE